MDEQQINRLMIKFEQLFRTSNRESINPQIDTLSIEDLKPIVNMVAKSRADYLKYVHELAKKYESGDQAPDMEELKKLKALRLRFQELSEGAKAFETSIQRGYLDIKE